MKLALVGCGNWGKHILRDLLSLGCEVVVVGRSEQSSQRATQLGAQQTVGSIRELPPVQGAVIATPSSNHIESIFEIRRWNADLPLFVEKPICISSREADSLRELDLSRVFVMDKWRYHPGVLALAALAKETRYGRLIGLKTMRLGYKSPHSDSNVLFHLLPHDLSIALEVMGEIPRAAAARMDISGSRIQGMVALLGDRPWLQCEVSQRFEVYHREVRAFFERAVVVLKGAYANGLEVYSTEEARENSTPKPSLVEISDNMPLMAELRAFVSYLTGGGPAPKSSAQEGLEAVRRIDELLAISNGELTASPGGPADSA